VISHALEDCPEVFLPDRSRYVKDHLIPSEAGEIPRHCVLLGDGPQEGPGNRPANTLSDFWIIAILDPGRSPGIRIRSGRNVADTHRWVRRISGGASYRTSRSLAGADKWALGLERELADNVEDARSSDGISVGDSAIRAFRLLTHQLAPFLSSSGSLKSGAFAEDNGCVALVIQSLTTDRRLTCRFSADGRTVHVIRIDEHMNSAVSHWSPDEGETLRGLAEWVLGKA